MKSLNIYKKIDIIVPIYNGFEYLENLFNQIRENTDLDFELYALNDNSPDERVLPLLKEIEKSFNGKMHLIENETNLGFLKTVNKGLELTKNDVCILNTDIQLPKKWASRLFYYILKNEFIASVTPFSNSATIFSFPNLWIDNELKIDFNKIDKSFSKLSLEKLPLLEFPTGVGFCMAMSRKALNQIGFFDEIFEKGYSEENDWCMRALRNGFKNVLCPNLFVYHKHGGSFQSEEKKRLCQNHLKIINERYPEYCALVSESANNKPYLYVRKILMRRYIFCLFKNFKFREIYCLSTLKQKSSKLFHHLFSISNKKKSNGKWHKIIYVLGIKISFRNKRKEKRLADKQEKKYLLRRLDLIANSEILNKFEKILIPPTVDDLNNFKNSNNLMQMYVPKCFSSVGKYTYCHPNLFVETSLQSKIGSFCSIGANVVIGHGEHTMDFLSTSPYFHFDRLGFKNKDMVSHDEYWTYNLKGVNIGNDVWIGTGVFIKNGITIGDGAIIGAESVVTHDVPPYAIVVGNPAHILRYRFNEETIKNLLELKWWNLDDEIIKQIPYDNIQSAIEFLKKQRKK